MFRAVGTHGPEHMPERMSKMAKRTSERMPERTPEHMSDRMTDRRLIYIGDHSEKVGFQFSFQWCLKVSDPGCGLQA